VAKTAVGDADRAEAEASLWLSNLVAMAAPGRRGSDFASKQGGQAGGGTIFLTPHHQEPLLV